MIRLLEGSWTSLCWRQVGAGAAAGLPARTPPAHTDCRDPAGGLRRPPASASTEEPRPTSPLRSSMLGSARLHHCYNIVLKLCLFGLTASKLCSLPNLKIYFSNPTWVGAVISLMDAHCCVQVRHGKSPTLVIPQSRLWKTCFRTDK